MSKKQFNVMTDNQHDETKHHSESKGINTDKHSVSTNVVPITPATMRVHFPENPSALRAFDFAPYYGQGFDAITAICQATIEKLIQQSVDTQQAAIAVSTITTYCRIGLKPFFGFLTLWHAGAKRDLQPVDITPELIEEFIHHLKASDIGYTSQKSYYTRAKAALTASHTQGYLPHADIKRLFLKNPFPNSNRKAKGQRPLTQAESKQLVLALKMEMTRILAGNAPLDSFDLTVCVLGIGMVTGMNPIPVLSLPTDCIQPHPLKHNLRLLVAFKRRGNATQVLSLRQSQDIALLRSVKLNAANTIEMIIERNAVLRQQYHDPMQLLVYQSKTGANKGTITALTSASVNNNINTLIDKHQLTDDDGKPMRLNMMRLRKTFVNRIWELSGQDPLIAARYGKHTPETSQRDYMVAPPEAETNMRFIGEARIESLRVSYGPKENTPISGCKDSKYGHRAPKDGTVCTETLDCFRCKSFVVTEEDLYRLFSFYWAAVRERDSFGIKNWNKYLRHIIRIIDEDIAPQFDGEKVTAAREKAKTTPHPFWRDLTMVRMAR